MTLQQKINTFEKLGLILTSADAGLTGMASDVHIHNGWFTRDNVLNAFNSWGNAMKKENLVKWLNSYKLTPESSKKIGVIMAGNIPLAGLHDMLCVLLSGHTIIAKASSDDDHLPKLIAEILISIEPDFKERIYFTDGQLKSIDAVIATGSNNSSGYFQYYFGKYPHIIRKNRNSVAVLNGAETAEEMRLLGKDIFQYFGLGCRSVSKLFVPENYDFDLLFRAVFDYQWLIQHNKYANNYEYNKTVYLMQGIKLLENGFLLLKEDAGLSSPVAVLFYEYYKNESDLSDRLKMDAPNIQCIVSNLKAVPARLDFGQAQNPQLWDYADGVDTLNFLSGLN
jgi:hypothetical protein